MRNQQNAETNVNFSSEHDHWQSNNRCNIRKPTMSQAIENLRILWSVEGENESEIDFACFQSSSAAMPTKIAFYENGKCVVVHMSKKPCLLDLVPIVTSTVRFSNLREQAQRLNLPIDQETLLLWKWIETDTLANALKESTPPLSDHTGISRGFSEADLAPDLVRTNEVLWTDASNTHGAAVMEHDDKDCFQVWQWRDLFEGPITAKKIFKLEASALYLGLLKLVTAAHAFFLLSLNSTSNEAR